MEQQYKKGDTEACITLEGDTTFQPIRREYCAHVTKTNKMAMCLVMCRRQFSNCDYLSEKLISRMKL